MLAFVKTGRVGLMPWLCLSVALGVSGCVGKSVPYHSGVVCEVWRGEVPACWPAAAAAPPAILVAVLLLARGRRAGVLALASAVLAAAAAALWAVNYAYLSRVSVEQTFPTDSGPGRRSVMLRVKTTRVNVLVKWEDSRYRSALDCPEVPRPLLVWDVGRACNEPITGSYLGMERGTVWLRHGFQAFHNTRLIPRSRRMAPPPTQRDRIVEYSTWEVVTDTAVAAPHWFVVGVLSAGPAAWAAGRWRRRARARRRRARGLCLGCGYDRRGTPPAGACPECGRGPA